MAIAALVLWALTAAAGAVLLLAGNACRRPAAPATAAAAPLASAPAASTAPAPPASRAAAPAATAPGGPARLQTAEPRPIPRVTVHAAPGEHPLLEFSHPVLGLLGLGLWFIYVGTHHRPLAWLSFGVLMLTIVAGLSWLGRTALAARRGSAPARFPPRLALLHGFAAAATVALAVLTALAANH